MDTDGLMEIALANADEGRVEITALEPAEFPTQVVGGLAELVFELVNNAITFSNPDEKVRVAGWFDQDNYLISISDSGVGIPGHLMDALNGVLEDLTATEHHPRSILGILVVARLAARHGISVCLVPGLPGTTARVTVPADLVARVEDEGRQKLYEAARSAASPEAAPPSEASAPPQPAPAAPPQPAPAADAESELLVDVTFDRDHDAAAGHGDPVQESARRRHQAFLETEAFLEEIFAPLWNEPPGSGLPAGRLSSGAGNGEIGNGGKAEAPSAVGPERSAGIPPLRVRVPGTNLTVTEDERSTAAGEAAVDIRMALTDFDQGRRSAEQASDRDDGQTH